MARRAFEACTMSLMRDSGGRRPALGLSVAAMLVGASARAEAPAQTLIWYRSADGCPDATVFLERLEARGVHARLAPVGGPLAFVVPLGTSMRLSAFGGGGSTAGGHGYSLLVIGGRLDACPTRLGGSTFHASPCVSVDLGTLRASGSGGEHRADSAFWAAVGAGMRLELRLSDRLALEAQAEAAAPLTRYDFIGGGPGTTPSPPPPAGPALRRGGRLLPPQTP